MSHGALVTFRCSKCGVKLKAKSELQGKPFSCPRCKTEVVIPAPAEYAELVEPTAVDGAGGSEVQPGLPPPVPAKDRCIGRWGIFFTTFLAVIVANIVTLLILGAVVAVLFVRFLDYGRTADKATGDARGIADAVLKQLEDSTREGDAKTQADRRKELQELLKVLQEADK